MRFTLTPAVRQLALAFPVLLIALPVAMSAAEEKLGPVLPPPSLYDVIPPAQPSVPASTVRTPAAPVQSAPLPVAASKTAEPVKPTAAPVASKPAPATAVAKPAPVAKAESVAPTEPWYRRWFGGPKPVPKSVPAQAPVAMAALDANGRGQYAYDSPSRTIRTGMLGQCVKTGAWDTSAATADCDPALVAKKPAPVKVAAAPLPVPAGSAPVRQAPPKPEPVEVVPLPPALPVARDERALQPEAEPVPVKEETITALAETHLMPEPDFDKLTLSAGALFPLSSAAIKPSGHEKLDEFVEHLRDMEFETVKIVGHTDPTGSKASNETLSKRRAEAVKSYLVSKGIDAKRIVTAGKGGAEPLPKTENCDALPRMEKIICYAPDRRVEIEVVSSKPHG